MRKFFSTKFLAVILIIAAICLGLAIYSGASGGGSPVSGVVGTVLSPFQKGISFVTGKAGSLYGYIFEYQSLQEENVLLKKQMSDMEQKVRDADLALEENDRLRALLGIKERHRSFEFEIAEVIARSPGNWATTITLDKGSNAGLREGNCVITEDGMVGYVSSVAPTSAEITTVVDTDMQAGALITRTRDIAIAEGNYELMSEGFLKLSYLKKDADVVIGDTVETSGRGGIFPKGIMIGTVERIIPEEHGISNYAVVRPFVDVEAVSHVFVIKSFDVTE